MWHLGVSTLTWTLNPFFSLSALFFLSPLPQAHVHSRRQLIAQKLADAARLFKWDLSNYYSLKASSDNSHRKVLSLYSLFSLSSLSLSIDRSLRFSLL